MQVASIKIAKAPMARQFDHGSFSRNSSSSVLLEVGDDDGLFGWGESAPRLYVTGETPQSVVEVLRSVSLREFDADLPLNVACESVVEIRRGLLASFPGALSAVAAVETALLDLVCQRHSMRMSEALLGVRQVLGDVGAPARAADYIRGFTTTVDTSRDPVDVIQRQSGSLSRSGGLVKLKSGPDVAATVALVRSIRDSLDQSVRISIDANGTWDQADAVRSAAELLALNVAWIEQPFQPGAWESSAKLEATGLPVMLDEGFLGAHDLVRAVEFGISYLNIRVSKCGGPLSSLELLRAASSAGLKFQLGVQVAEVGPLWATARALAAVVPEFVAVEIGRQDEWFDSALTDPQFHVDRIGDCASVPAGVGHGVRPSAHLAAYLSEEFL